MEQMVKKTKSFRRILGVVVSNKMQKTVVVEVSTLTRHAKYGKYFKKYKKYKAHDENNSCGLGDQIEIIESRPLSKEKRFRVSRIIEKAKRLDLGEASVG